MRTASFIIDVIGLIFVLVFVSIFLSYWIVYTADYPEHMGINELTEIRSYVLENEPHLFLMNWVVQGVFIVLYFFVFPLVGKKPHQTLGMMMLNLTILDHEANEITRKQYVKREAWKWISFFGFYQTFNSEKRSLADIKTSTYVMKY